MSSFQKSIKRISAEIAEMRNQLEVLLANTRDSHPRAPEHGSSQRISPHIIRQEENLLGPILDATKMSLKLIQANSLELLTSIQGLIPQNSSLEKRLTALEKKLHVKLNFDIENRAIEMVRANREFAMLVNDILMQYSDNLKSRGLFELQERQQLLRNKKEEHSRLISGMEEKLRQLELDKAAIGEELEAVSAERGKLEAILANMLKEMRLVKISGNLETQDMPTHANSLMTPFQEVFELNRCSFSVLKFGTHGPEIVTTEKLSFMAPETNNQDQDDWLVSIGAYYFTIIGQGEGYARGLFGPLPVRNHDDYMAYIYSFLAEDPLNLDKRSRGVSYILFCFFFPKSISIAFSSYELMKNTLDFIISEPKSVEEVDSKLLGSIREAIIGVLTEKALDSSNIDRESDLTMQDALAQSSLMRIILIASNQATLKKSLAHLLEQVWSTLQTFDVKNLKINLTNGAQIQGKLTHECFRGFGFGRPWRNVDAVIILVSKEKISWTEVHALERIMDEVTQRELPLGVLTPISITETKASAAKKHLIDFISNMAGRSKLASSVYSGEISAAQLKKIILTLGSWNRKMDLTISQTI
ncbi:MAG: hypothetical protein ACE5OZ_03735 [Candidatus Heimdallarchaeota archaeon]